MILEVNYDWLLELTSIPTAAGREGRVVRWVMQWLSQRPDLELTTDASGNMLIALKAAKREASDVPVIFTAHLDHPAFVVIGPRGEHAVQAAFRGGVKAAYFLGSPVTLHKPDGSGHHGVIDWVSEAETAVGEREVTARFEEAVDGVAGQMMTWHLPASTIQGRVLRAPACDDLAGVAAGLMAMEQLRQTEHPSDVRLLLTRAEEIGFIGAIAACKAGLIPKDARLINIENSKSLIDSPQGAGPIVRVGDRTGIFDPDTTYRASEAAMQLASHDPSFKFQRKLMAGGTCEASAFATLGYAATGICLPLGNYHNMNESTGRIDSEFINLDDFDHLVRLLLEVASAFNGPKALRSFRERLDALFANRSCVLDEPMDG